MEHEPNPDIVWPFFWAEVEKIAAHAGAGSLDAIDTSSPAEDDEEKGLEKDEEDREEEKAQLKKAKKGLKEEANRPKKKKDSKLIRM